MVEKSSPLNVIGAIWNIGGDATLNGWEDVVVPSCCSWLRFADGMQGSVIFFQSASSCWYANCKTNAWPWNMDTELVNQARLLMLACFLIERIKPGSRRLLSLFIFDKRLPTSQRVWSMPYPLSSEKRMSQASPL